MHALNKIPVARSLALSRKNFQFVMFQVDKEQHCWNVQHMWDVEDVYSLRGLRPIYVLPLVQKVHNALRH
jgi:hypothetical protein